MDDLGIFFNQYFRDQLESSLISTPRHVHTCTTVTGIELSLAPAPRLSSPHVFPFPSRLSPRHRTGAFLSGISSLHGARYLLLLVPICGTRCASHDVLPLATRGPPLHLVLPLRLLTGSPALHNMSITDRIDLPTFVVNFI